MIVDFTEGADAVLEGRIFDVCIVGAGPAGITLATNLSRNLSVLLLEGGGLEPSEESQQIYQGTVTGRDYDPLDTCRIRCFGGTSNHWGGRCQVLDDNDFQARPHVPHSGWPIGKKDLDPHFDRAAEIVDLDTAEPNPHIFRARLDQAFSTDRFLRPFKFFYSPPTQFGTKFRSHIEESSNITCLLRANLTDILLNEAGTAVSDVEITGYGRERATVPVRRLILAAGGIENPRILMNCNKQVKAGLGNQHDLVGRFFTEHPGYRCGWLLLQDDLRDALFNAFETDAEGFEGKYFYAADPRFAEEHGTLNFVLSAIFRTRHAAFKEELRQAMCEPDWLNGGLEFVLGNPEQKWCHDGYFRTLIEQAPNPDSRVTLSDDKDAFGWRRINLDWRLLPIDKRTITVAVTQFATVFATHDLGRVRVSDWALADDPEPPGVVVGADSDPYMSYHHMGTTRMSDDPKRGVVDRDCRVHGISNLYMAGSSVFPTVGFVNPTFTIVQLSLRLASRLNAS